MARCRNTLLYLPCLRVRRCVCLTCMHNHFLQPLHTSRQTNKQTDTQILGSASSPSLFLPPLLRPAATKSGASRRDQATGVTDRKSFRKRRMEAMTMILRTRDHARPVNAQGKSQQDGAGRDREGRVAAEQTGAKQSRPD